MQNNILPTVGSVGTYVFSAPFNTLILPGEQYTCQGIRSISELANSGVDVFKKYYEPYGLTLVQMETALNNNDFIVSLQGGTGIWVYIPASYIMALPNENGVPYHIQVIGLSLGPIPTTRDLSALKTLLSNVVYDNLGIVPEIKEIEVSRVTVVDSDNHALIENTRALNITNRQTDAGRYLTTVTALNAALAKVTKLENYIIANKTKLGI